VKILTGRLRGRTVPFRPNPHLRPTTDKVRKAIFDSLQGAVEGRRVLDLFGGTGLLGMEALSLGAQSAVFVEKDAVQCRRIEEALESLGVTGAAEVRRADALAAVAAFGRADRRFDLVFLDQPYGEGLGVRALEALAASKLLDEGALVLLECEKDEPAPSAAGALRAVRSSSYGDTRTVLYRKEGVS